MMTLREALEPVAAHRRDRVVIPTMASVGVWPSLSDTPRDFHYLPSSMGQGVSVGLGRRRALPGLGVVVLTGDGSLLMNLGCLVTAGQYKVSLTVVLLDNGLYEVTGGQPVAGGGRVDFGALAQAAGFDRVYGYEAATDWAAGAADVLSGDGPVFVWLKVAGETGKATPAAPRPMAEQIGRLRAALADPT